MKFSDFAKNDSAELLSFKTILLLIAIIAVLVAAGWFFFVRVGGIEGIAGMFTNMIIGSTSGILGGVYNAGKSSFKSTGMYRNYDFIRKNSPTLRRLGLGK